MKILKITKDHKRDLKLFGIRIRVLGTGSQPFCRILCSFYSGERLILQFACFRELLGEELYDVCKMCVYK